MGNPSVQVRFNKGVAFNPDWLEFASTTTPFEPKSNTGISRQELQFLVSVLDLTSLESDDDSASISRLFERAVQPLPRARQTTAGVCVFSTFLGLAGTWVTGSGVKLVAVAGGFPHALNSLTSRIDEVRSISGLADEIDLPIPRYLAKEGKWEELYEELSLLVGAARGTPVKVILGTGELNRDDLIYKAAMTAMMAGASFVKTSTGKERVNATFGAGTVICEAIRNYGQRSGHIVGIKPAGGIRTAAEAKAWIDLVRERLGTEFLTPQRIRIGASALLDHIRQAWEGEDRPISPVVY